MKRRRLIQSALGASVLPSQLFSQEQPREEAAKLVFTQADSAAAAVPRFFNSEQFSAFARLGELLMPANGTTPGSREAEAAVFLDFLLSQSSSEKKQLFLAGVTRLNRDATARYTKPFARLTAEEAGPILAPLAQPWTYQPPADPFAQFIRTAKDEFWQATINSRQWAEAMSSRSRGAAGVGLYWLPIE